MANPLGIMGIIISELDFLTPFAKLNLNIVQFFYND